VAGEIGVPEGSYEAAAKEKAQNSTGGVRLAEKSSTRQAFCLKSVGNLARCGSAATRRRS
jgi:hypothetical protein